MTIIYVCIVVLDYSDEYPPGIILLDMCRFREKERRSRRKNHLLSSSTIETNNPTP